MKGISACRYSLDGIKAGLSALKGKDRAAAALLHEAEQYGLDVCIATFKIWQAGCGYSKYDLDAQDSEYELTGWITLTGSPASHKTLNFDIEEEVIPVSQHVMINSDESHF